MTSAKAAIKPTEGGANILMSAQGFVDLAQVQDGKDLHWTTDVSRELPIKMNGEDETANMKPTTLPSVFLQTAELRKS